MENTRKRILLALSALLIGSLLYIFGISLTESFAPMLVYYAIALLLYISAFLSIYHHYKQEKASIDIYIMCLTTFLIILTTYVTLSHIF